MSLRVLFEWNGEPTRFIYTAYRQYGYRLAEIAAQLGGHGEPSSQAGGRMIVSSGATSILLHLAMSR